ncbi:HK97 gp10 family phage protein [Jeotgalibaca porci]|uniref:HK97 gp10 family phage protein n=1 Tax=Jeotgalibaca porci TaxID=1868793 RepID=UPI0035A0F563
MTRNRRISIDQLADVIDEELTMYHKDTNEKIKKSTRKAMRGMVKDTKAQTYMRDTGAYRGAIASRTLVDTVNGLTLQWYVKAPHYRLSHLLEYGHATRNGGRTIAYGFIGKAADTAEELYLKEIERALSDG